MTNPLRQISPDLLEAARTVREKAARRSSLTISTAGVPPPSTEEIVNSVFNNAPGWRPAEFTKEELAERERQEFIDRTGMVPAPEVEFDDEETLRARDGLIW